MATPTKSSVALFPTPEDRTRFLAWVDVELKPGVDYILAHRKGCPVRDQQGRSCQGCGAKATLSKAGAERVCIHLGLVPQFARDQDTWEMLGKKVGMLCYVCSLHRGSATGPVMGEGRGARTVEQDGGDVNMAIKMAEKSSAVNATLRTAGLSERFTQDVGENEPVVRAEGRHLPMHGVSGVPTGVAPSPAPRAQEPARAVQIEDGPPTPRVSPSEATGTLQTPGDGTPGAAMSGSGAEVRSEPSAPTEPVSSAQKSTPSSAGPAMPAGLPPLTHPVEFTLPNGQVVKGQCTAGVTAETVSALIARTSAGAPLQARAAAYLAEYGLPALRYLDENQGRALLGLLTEEGPRVLRRANGGGELDWPTAHAELVRVAHILSQPTAADRAAGTAAPTISVKEIEALAAAVFQVDSVQQIKPFELMRVAAEIETMGLKDRPALALALGRVGQGT